MAKLSLLAVLGALIPALGGCTTPPEGVTPVSGFDADRYLGTWYEIARLDHRFERGLVAVTATYSRNPDGSLKVINKGFKPDTCSWKEAEGRAKFAGDPAQGQLAVSFFGPFYGGYTVFALDHREYRWAAVSGPNRSYLWLLARTPTLADDVRDRLVAEAEALGFATDALIWVPQEVPPC